MSDEKKMPDTPPFDPENPTSETLIVPPPDFREQLEASRKNKDQQGQQAQTPVQAQTQSQTKPVEASKAPQPPRSEDDIPTKRGVFFRRKDTEPTVKLRGGTVNPSTNKPDDKSDKK